MEMKWCSRSKAAVLMATNKYRRGPGESMEPRGPLMMQDTPLTWLNLNFVILKNIDSDFWKNSMLVKFENKQRNFYTSIETYNDINHIL